MPNATLEWLPLVTLFMFTIATVTTAAWRLFLSIDRASEALRIDFMLQLERSKEDRHRDIAEMREAMRGQDRRLDTFRAEVSSAQREVAISTKEDLRRLDAKIDVVITAVAKIASDLSAVRTHV